MNHESKREGRPMMDISVVIPSYRAEKTIGQSLQNVLSQKFSGSYEVIVCDSSPGPEVQDIASRYPVKFIKRTKIVPPGIARNIGAESAQGELLVFMDADITLDPGALEEIWKCYQKGQEIFSVALELGRESRALSAHIEHYLFFCEYQKGRRPEERKNLPSTVLVVQKKLFFDFGGFKGFWRGEDTDFTERLNAAGKRPLFMPRIVARRNQNIPFWEIANKYFKQGIYWGRKSFSGATGIKRPVVILMLPFLSILKTGRIVYRNAVYNEAADKALSLLLSPLLFFLGCWWAAGIVSGLCSDISDKGERSE